MEILAWAVNYGSFWLMAGSVVAGLLGLFWELGPGEEPPFSHREVSHIGCFVALVAIVLFVVGVIWTLVGRHFGFVTWVVPIPADIFNFGYRTPTPR